MQQSLAPKNRPQHNRTNCPIAAIQRRQLRRDVECVRRSALSAAAVLERAQKVACAQVDEVNGGVVGANCHFTH